MSYSWNNVEIRMNKQMTENQMKGLIAFIQVDEEFNEDGIIFYNNNFSRFTNAGSEADSLDVNAFTELLNEYCKTNGMKADYTISNQWYDTREEHSGDFALIEDGEVVERISNDDVFTMLEERKASPIKGLTPIQIADCNGLSLGFGDALMVSQPDDVVFTQSEEDDLNDGHYDELEENGRIVFQDLRDWM